MSLSELLEQENENQKRRLDKSKASAEKKKREAETFMRVSPQLIVEVIEPAIDEIIADFSKKKYIANKKQKISVSYDNARGIRSFWFEFRNLIVQLDIYPNVLLNRMSINVRTEPLKGYLFELNKEADYELESFTIESIRKKVEETITTIINHEK